LFVSQDDFALALSQKIWGDVPRIGDINPEAEPYYSEFKKDRIQVFDLTKFKSNGDDAHSRAFEKAGTVAEMIRARLQEGQQLSDRKVDLSIGD
jgi:esterase/lipase superfamily enzyme